MKIKIKNTLLALLILFSLGMTIRTCKLERELKTSEHSLQFLIDHPIVHTDTFYTEAKNINPPKALPNEVIPSRVIHPNETKSLGGRPENTFEQVQDSSRLTSRDSLIGIDLNQNLFTFTFQNPTFGYHQSQFNIKPDEYQYVWVDGKLTAKRLSVIKRMEFKPYTSLSYRPIHNLWDWEIGISFKTKSLNYNLGFNAFYYPQWQSKPGMDATIRITYNF